MRHFFKADHVIILVGNIDVPIPSAIIGIDFEGPLLQFHLCLGSRVLDLLGT